MYLDPVLILRLVCLTLRIYVSDNGRVKGAAITTYVAVTSLWKYSRQPSQEALLPVISNKRLIYASCFFNRVSLSAPGMSVGSVSLALPTL